ncbi:MAG: MTH1187 family thiamine-binding protein [Dehalococcoidia bacterium]|nr:MTH1187 family thiamine-binding protein [Dehalococcoidia bacterium]
MAIVELSVVPLGTKTPSVSQYVARAIKVLEKEKDIKYEITAMGTIIQGDLDRILAVVRKMHEGTFGDGVVRVLTTVKIDDRRDKAQTMGQKVNSLKNKLQA